MEDLTTTLWGLLISAYISSTLLPGGSEALLTYMAQQQTHTVTQLLLVATLGNTLGGITTWAMGRICAIKYPLDTRLKARHRVAVDRIQRWSSPILLLSWVPLVGDPLCFAAGWLKLSFVQSFFYILLGKMLRYLLILGVIDWIF